MERWVQLLRESTRAKGVGPKEVARLICVSESSYHKRCRGSVQFSAPEFATLCDHFGLPGTPSGLTERRLSFTVPATTSDTFCASRYLERLTRLARVMEAAVDGRGSVEVAVSSSDIPVFQLFREPTLVAFKLFVFGTAHAVEVAQRLCVDEAIDLWSEHIAAAQHIAGVYARLPTREVWGINPLEGLLYQIAHLVRARAIDSVDLAKVIAAVRRLVGRITADAQAGQKAGSGARFQLYQNRLHASSTTVTAALLDQTLTFLTVDNPNFVRSDQATTYAFFLDTFEQIRRRSTPINGTGIYTARLFAEDLEAHVRRLEESMGYQLRAYRAF